MHDNVPIGSTLRRRCASGIRRSRNRAWRCPARHASNRRNQRLHRSRTSRRCRIAAVARSGECNALTAAVPRWAADQRDVLPDRRVLRSSASMIHCDRTGHTCPGPRQHSTEAAARRPATIRMTSRPKARSHLPRVDIIGGRPVVRARQLGWRSCLSQWARRAPRTPPQPGPRSDSPRSLG